MPSLAARIHPARKQCLVWQLEYTFRKIRGVFEHLLAATAAVYNTGADLKGEGDF